MQLTDFITMALHVSNSHFLSFQLRNPLSVAKNIVSEGRLFDKSPVFVILFDLLQIAVRPEAPPQIQGLQPEYALHETVDVMCTSARAFPAAKLDFFVNDEPVSSAD